MERENDYDIVEKLDDFLQKFFLGKSPTEAEIDLQIRMWAKSRNISGDLLIEAYLLYAQALTIITNAIDSMSDRELSMMMLGINIPVEDISMLSSEIAEA